MTETDTISDEDFTRLLQSLVGVTECEEAKTCLDILGKVGERYDNKQYGTGFLAVCLLCASLFESYANAAEMDDDCKNEIINCVRKP